MNRIEFDSELKAELGHFHYDDAVSEDQKHEVLKRALGNIKERHPNEDLAAMFDSNRTLTPEELEYIAGGTLISDSINLVADSAKVIVDIWDDL